MDAVSVIANFDPPTADFITAFDPPGQLNTVAAEAMSRSGDNLQGSLGEAPLPPLSALAPHF